MHLTPREVEKLMVHNAGYLAQKRLARGLRLNHVESIALIAAQLHEFIRDGEKKVAELMDLGKQFLGRREVLPGVPEMIAGLQVEGTFPDGTKLVSVHDPISNDKGNLELCFYGSFLPQPDPSVFADDSGVSDRLTPFEPGEVMTEEGEVELLAGRESISLKVTNTGDRPIQIGSHFHFMEVNAALRFDREKAYGKKLDIPAGKAIRFEPGDEKTVDLVDYAGAKIICGFNGIAEGEINDSNRSAAMQRVQAGNYLHSST